MNTTLRKGVYPGTFDPVTYGHLTTLADSLDIFDVVYMLMVDNPDKKGQLTFTIGENLEFAREAFRLNPVLNEAYENGRIVLDYYDGFTVDYAHDVGAQYLIRGLRTLTDFVSEQQLCHVNNRFAPEIKTWFVMAREEHQLISSSYAKNIIRGGKDGSWLVPHHIEEALKRKYQK